MSVKYDACIRICGHVAITNIPLLQYCNATNIFYFLIQKQKLLQLVVLCVSWVHFCLSPIYNQQKKRGRGEGRSSSPW